MFVGGRIPQPLVGTNIQVIDKYYNTINNSEEIERLKFVLEYKRLLAQASYLWKTHHILSVE
jgi:hypothetical protein